MSATSLPWSSTMGSLPFLEFFRIWFACVQGNPLFRGDQVRGHDLTKLLCPVSLEIDVAVGHDPQEQGIELAVLGDRDAGEPVLVP